MRLALVSSGFATRSGGLGRQVDALARGLASRGIDVELVTQDGSIRSPSAVVRNGVRIRQFPTSIGRLRFGMAPALWEYLRRTAGSWDVVHLHSTHGALGLAVGNVPSRRLVFTPHVPVGRLVRRPYGHVARAVIDRAAHTVSLSEVEAELIRSNFPRAAERVRATPPVVDVSAIGSARAVPCDGEVVLAVGRLERCERLERTIAAMAGLDKRFRLVVLGEGPGARRLGRYAADLRVAERVHFAGPASGVALYRWLRSARVVVTLGELEPSGFKVLEALAAGASVVAADVPVHREAAWFTAGTGVRLVPGECSPIELSDAIAGVAEVQVPLSAQQAIPATEAVVDELLPLYRSLAGGPEPDRMPVPARETGLAEAR